MICYVYIIARNDDGHLAMKLDGVYYRSPIKIGISNNPDARLQQLKTACPIPIALLAKLKCPNRDFALELEKTMHNSFASRRIHHLEWFEAPPWEAVEHACRCYRAMASGHSKGEVGYSDWAEWMADAGVLTLEERFDIQPFPNRGPSSTESMVDFDRFDQPDENPEEELPFPRA